MSTKNNRKEFITSCIVTVILSAAVLMGLIFHETWYDEAQAYLIARDASLHDILFYLPHYEGHPPLWHLLLKGVIALGVPYPVSLKAVQFFLYEAVIIIIEFRSPFSRFMKTIMPLSFYLIYQYAVVSRPYILLLLGCLLTAMAYKKRKEKPFLYIMSLFVMCLGHSYGIAMAGGIVVSDMTGECIRQRSLKNGLSDVLKNTKLLVSYVILLAGALLVIADIIPRSDAFGTSIVSARNHSIFVTFLLTWFYIPSETMFTSFSSQLINLQKEKNPIGEVVGAVVISAIIWAVLLRICHRRKMAAELLIPYLFVSFILTSYSYAHHFGIFLMFLIFILWTAEEKEPIRLSEIREPLVKAGLSESLFKKIVSIAAAAFICINLYWDGCSYYRELTMPYDASVGLARWIKDNGLEDRKLLASWSKTDTHVFSASAFASEAYFDKNIYYNMYKDQTYMSHIMATEEDINTELEYMRSFGAPDFMICDSPLEVSDICKTFGLTEKYIAEAYHGKGRKIFKDKDVTTDVFVYCTMDTYRELYGKDYVIPSYKES